MGAPFQLVSDWESAARSLVSRVGRLRGVVATSKLYGNDPVAKILRKRKLLPYSKIGYGRGHQRIGILWQSKAEREFF